MKIYERNYDNPIRDDGTAKPNELIGDFDIIETLLEDYCRSERIGTLAGNVYLISEVEVSARANPEMAGSRFEVKELTSLRVR